MFLSSAVSLAPSGPSAKRRCADRETVCKRPGGEGRLGCEFGSGACWASRVFLGACSEFLAWTSSRVIPLDERLRIKLLRNKDGGEREKRQFREDEEEEAVRHKELKLRNYEPEDEELKKRKVPQAKPASVEDKVKDQLEAAKPEPIIDEVDLANLAPRKPDWDLKRDVAKKLEKLEKRTQRAIAELIRERLKGQEEELASAVGSAKQDGSDSD
ncbi:coiled-coil domain-containing protein 12 isoform X2 [Apteryx rowi]|uniref:coiled-coil domain-containing protein 12 isoform X2 n=1 Tax=Apteryx rowi TaxID=308060 RepID=UPI000E1D9504|nr:coiled-coil domain-containing protein 12 isoform X2 [Apteryx rowi]